MKAHLFSDMQNHITVLTLQIISKEIMINVQE